MNPLISVIVPVYNMESHLNKCLTSITNQTFHNLEIIVVDDGSTDGSLELCEKYADQDNRIKVVHKINGGLSSARNAGLDVCSGDYIGFVDSDDWIADDMYEKLLSICTNNKTIATISMAQVNNSGKVLNEIIFPNQIVTVECAMRSILCHQDGGSVCSRLFPRDVIGSARFDETKLNEDILFMVSLVDNFEFVSYTSSIGYYYLQREGSISRHFGKAVHDMVGNSVWIRSCIETLFPVLTVEAERFEIFQHMSFLLCCPYHYDWKKDELCGHVLKYVRSHLWVGIRNPYITRREKMKLLGVAFFPKMMSKLLELKNQYGVNQL